MMGGDVRSPEADGDGREDGEGLKVKVEVEVEGFINKAEVSRRLRMKPRTIDDWMRRGLIPYYRVGRAVRFKWSEVEEHLAKTCRVCGEK